MDRRNQGKKGKSHYKGNNNSTTTAKQPKQRNNRKSNTEQQNRGNTEVPQGNKDDVPQCTSTIDENKVCNTSKRSMGVGTPGDKMLNKVPQRKQVDVLQCSSNFDEKRNNVSTTSEGSMGVGTGGDSMLKKVSQGKKVDVPQCSSTSDDNNVYNTSNGSMGVGTGGDPMLNKVPEEKEVDVSRRQQVPLQEDAHTSGGRKKSAKETEEDDKIAQEIEEAKKEWKTPGIIRKSGSLKETSILSNHLKITFKSQLPKTFYHYDVKFSVDRRWLYRNVIRNYCENHDRIHNTVFDGVSNLYSTLRIPDEEREDTIVLANARAPIECVVTLTEVNRISTAPLRNLGAKGNESDLQTLAQCLNIVLGDALVNSEAQYTKYDNVYIARNQELKSVGCGMGMKLGLFQSVVFGTSDTFLNVAVKQKVFPMHQQLIYSIWELLNLRDLRYLRELTPTQRREVERYVRGLKIKYTDTNKKDHDYYIVKLEESAKRSTFKYKGKDKTVNEYFQECKNKTIKYPDLPCISVNRTAQREPANPPIILPMEFCAIIGGGIIKGKLPNNVTSKLITIAGSAQKRRSQILETITDIDINQFGCIKEFGMKINVNFVDFKSKILAKPKIMYADRLKNVNDKGSWQLTNVGLYTPAPSGAITWGIIDISLDSSNTGYIEPFIVKMRETCRGVNLILASNPQTVRCGKWNPDEFRQALKRTKSSCKIMIVIISNDNQYYGKIKNLAELHEGCLTQCIKLITFEKISGKKSCKYNNEKDQLICNLAMKMNAKLNGTNHILRADINLLKWPFMIMGADVIHPTHNSDEEDSIATVTASFDQNAFKYNIFHDQQTARQEMIENLEEMTFKQLKYFKEKNDKKLPDAILFFRDGVSDGQFSLTYHKEIKAVKKACTRLYDNGKDPTITFLIVQKRHNTRFFPSNPKQSDENNVPVGTCVDTVITNSKIVTFYLLSHYSDRGLAHPSKYVLLHDDYRFDIDKLEQLTFRLCHLLARCTKSISYPAPTYYADLAATRIRAYGTHDDVAANELDENNVHFKFKRNTPMFFV